MAAEPTAFCGEVPNTMAQVTYTYPIDHLSGKVGKHETGFSYRSKTTNKHTVCYGKRSTQPSTAELARRQKFASVAASTKTRMLNATMLAQDKVAFAAQSRYKYLRNYVFAQEWANYAG